MPTLQPPAVLSIASHLPVDLTDRLRALRDALLSGLVERDVAIRLALLATLAGEHVLLVGPPGTAKSLIAQRLRLGFASASYFERLLTRFTVPEELFGPLSIDGLQHDRYERLTEKYLPTSSIVFLDEIFKANSAILNALLTVLNERKFDNGTKRVDIPLLAVIGASNELPQGDELGALFDRFLLRLHVGPVSTNGFRSLLGLRGDAAPQVPAHARFTADELRAVQAEASAVEVPEEVAHLLVALRDWCLAEGISVSDRRWRKIVRLLQTSALTNGRRVVSVWDCWLLQHCTWDKPEDREKVFAWYAERVGASGSTDLGALTRVVTVLEKQLRGDQAARSQKLDPSGALLWKKWDGTPTTHREGRVQQARDGEALYLAPATSGHSPFAHRHNPDRTNGGRGYTERELDNLPVQPMRLAFRNWPERSEYLADHANWLVQDVLYEPFMEATAHRRPYIEAQIDQVDDLMCDVKAYADELRAHREHVEQELARHLWVTSDFIAPATRALAATARSVDELFRRALALREGFEALPCDDATASAATGTGGLGDGRTWRGAR